MTFDLKSLVRPNILSLEPYRCARDDYSEGILLDANENAYGSVLSTEDNFHRYPDPLHNEVKEKWIKYRNLDSVKQAFFGVGSDEVIDLAIRIFCTPGKDKILINTPTYGMYSVCAKVNDVEVIKVSLTPGIGDIASRFQLRLDQIEQQLINEKGLIKVIFLCSPGNPTGTSLDFESIKDTLNLGLKYGSIVVVDEAYVDFADQSACSLIKEYPNLIVMQTLSKSFGLAGIRLGAAFGNSELIHIFNCTKAPYNICSLTAGVANEALSDAGIEKMEATVSKLNSQREILIQKLKQFELVGEHLGNLDANFVLAPILDPVTKEPNSELAKKVYLQLADDHQVVVRYRANEDGCRGCLRITIGTPEEIDTFLNRLQTILDKLAK
jgi:histidinol-phosphate aminotransferase